MATKKRSLEDFFKPQEQEIQIPFRPKNEEEEKVVKKTLVEEKKKNEAGKGNDVIEVAGFLREPRGVSAAQTEKPAPKPKVPIREVIPPTEQVNPPTKQGGTFVPPAPVQNPAVAMPQASKGASDWERAMIGATPLLVGWLTGNELEGTELAGSTLAGTEADRYKRENDFNQKLAEMQAKKSMSPASGKGMQAKTFEYAGSDGRPRIGRFINGEYYRDEATDPLAHVKPEKDSFITKTVKDEKTGKLMEVAYNPVTKETQVIGEAKSDDSYDFIPTVTDEGPTRYQIASKKTGDNIGFLPGQVPAKSGQLANEGKDERQIRQIRVGLLKDVTKPTSVYSQRREAMEGMARAATLLNEGGPIGASGLRMILARSVFGEKGPLSDGDVTRLSGDPSAQAAAARIWDKYLIGAPLTREDRADVRKVIDVAAKLAEQDANGYLDGYLDTYKAEGYDLKPQLQHFREMPKIPAFRAGTMAGPRTPRVPRGTSAAQTSGPQPGLVQDGFKYIGGDPSKPENWEKQ